MAEDSPAELPELYSAADVLVNLTLHNNVLAQAVGGRRGSRGAAPGESVRA
jgi:hypothetical protein